MFRSDYEDLCSDVSVCPVCGTEIKDHEFEKVVWHGKEHWVCPYCLAELLNTEYVALTYSQLEERRREKKEMEELDYGISE